MKLQTLLLLLIISLISACNQDEDVKHDAQSSHHHKTTSGFVGKPQAPVNLNYEFLNTPVVGETLQIQLKITTEQESEMMQVNYTVSSPLESGDATQVQFFANVAKGQAASYIIHVVPKQVDLSYVNVFVSTIVRDKKQSRAFAIPVSIEQTLPSSVILQKKPQNLRLPQGFEHNPQQNIIIMPATESP